MTPARQVDRHALTGLVHSARARGLRAPTDGWLAQLADGARHIGLLADEGPDETLLVVWTGETRSGRRLGALLELPAATWHELDEVEVPNVLVRWARQVAEDAGAVSRRG